MRMNSNPHTKRQIRQLQLPRAEKNLINAHELKVVLWAWTSSMRMNSERVISCLMPHFVVSAFDGEHTGPCIGCGVWGAGVGVRMMP